MAVPEDEQDIQPVLHYGARASTIHAVFQSRAPMVIDRYQRDYSWTADEIQEFLEDILRLLERREYELTASHFFGGIVAVRFDRHGWDREVGYEIVDGQQRLATFCLTAAAFIHGYRRLQAEAGADLVDRIRARERRDTQVYLWRKEADPVDTEVEVGALTVSRRDADYFSRLLTGEVPEAHMDTRPSHTLLREAYAALSDSLVTPILALEVSAEERLGQLRDRREAIMSGAQVIFISGRRKSDAYRLFAVLNDRGRRLEQGDLLRAYTLLLLDGATQHQEECEAVWDRLDLFEASELDDLLRAYFASVQGVRASRGDLYDLYRDAFFDNREDPLPEDQANQVLDFMGRLEQEANTFRVLTRGDWPYEGVHPVQRQGPTDWEKDRLTRLIKLMGRDRLLPLLMAVVADRDEDYFRGVIRFLEMAEFRWIVCNAHPSTLANIYFDNARAIRTDDGYSLQELADDIEPWVARFAGDDTFRTLLPEKVSYTSSDSARRLKHLLTTLEDYWSWYEDGAVGEPRARETRRWLLDSIDVEHIYPQTAEPADSDPDLEPIKHAFGNLTLLWWPDNVFNSNRPPIEKAPDYRRADQPELTKTVGRSIEADQGWTPRSIEDRQGDLVPAAEAVYRLRPESVIRAAQLPRRRRRRAVGRASVEPPASTGIWLVAQDETSEYEDLEGELYHYSRRIPNGNRVGVGDVLICHRSSPQAVGRRLLFGVAVVGEVRDGEDGSRKALFSRYAELNPAVPIGELGEDPRTNRQNSINEVDEAFLNAVLRRLGAGSIQEVPETAN